MASSVHSSSSSWACATCTLLNPATKRRCQVCQSRKPVEQHQPSVVIDNNNSIVAIDITSPTRKKNNRKRKFPDKKKDGTTIATTDVKNSTNVKNSSIGDHQITAATIATIASSSTNKKTKKRQCMPRTSNDHVEKGDGIRSIRSSDGTNNKVNNDDANIHTINTTKKNDNDSNITHRNVDESDAKSAAICAIIEDNITKVVKDTATNNSDKSNTRINCIESKAIQCPDNTEYQQPQPQQDEQTTNEIQRSSNPDLIINRDTQQNLLQHFQHQQSNNNIDTNYGHPVDGGVELIEAPEKIVQERYATTGSIDGQERQEQYNRLKGVDDDLNEIKMKACNKRSENDNMLIIEKSEYNNAHTISMKGSSVTGSEGTMDDTTRCRSTQAQSNGENKTSAHNTATDITAAINQRTMPRMMVGNKPTRKEGIDNGKYDIPDRDMIRNNNAINNEELLSELDGDGLISPSHVSSPLIVNNANNGNKNNDGDDDTTDLPTTHGIGIHIIGNSCNTKKAKESKENVSVDEISNEYSTKLQNKNSDALIMTNDAKKEIGIVTINSLPPWKDFDNEKACSFPRNKTDDVGKDALHDKTIGTKNVQLIPKQRTRPQDDDTQQLHGSCDIEKVEHSRSSTQSKSLSLVCNFDYPMSTSFAYTPPGAETQSSQEGMADDDDDADNNDDVEENSAAEIRRSSPFYRHELSFKNDLDSNASSSPSKIKYQRMNDSLSSNTTVPNQYPDHLQVTKTNEKMHAVALKDDQRKLNIDPSGRSTNVSASANFNLGTSMFSETVPNPYSLFKTAGSGAFISVSKETVEEAERMLNKSFEIDSKIAIPEVPSRISKFPTAASALPSKRKSMNSFQTAGACNKVLASEHRSKDKLGKHLKNKTVLCNNTASASLPELSSSSTKNIFPSIAMKSESSAIFRTAGNGTEFILSEKSLERANGIFEISRGVKRPLNETNSGMILSAAAISTSKVSLDMFQKAGSVDAISMLDSRLHGKSLCSTESFRSSSTSGAVMKNNFSEEKSETVSTGTITFQPVGTGTTVSASNENIIEMERILNNTSVSSLNDPSALRTLSGESPPSGTMMRTFQTSKFDNATKFEPSRGGPKDIEPVSIPILQTADSGKAMYVCDKTVEEMGKMLETEPSSSSKPIIHPKGKKISAVAMGMFQTAGSGGAISVSNDKLEEMGRFLSRPSISRKESSFDRIKEKNVPTAAMGMFQTAGSGGAISVSNDKCEEMGRLLNRPSTSRKELSFDRIKEKNVPTAAMGMFQTAGSGGAISVSNDKLEEMGRFLSRPSTSRKESSFDRIKEKNVPTAAMGMFQTAGSGGAISVSNDKCEEMGRLLNRPSTSRKELSFDRIKEKNVPTAAMGMFQTAGSGGAISVSNDKCKEMGRLLNRPSTSRKELSFDRIKEKIVPTAAMGMFQTAGSGGAISVSNDKCKEMGRLLNRPSIFRKESSFDEILKVKSVRNVKTSFASKGKVCTPVRGVMGTPHNRFIQIDSNISDEHRTIPPSFLSNNNQSFPTRIKIVPDSIVKEGFQAQSFAQGQSPRSPPKEFNMIPTRSANVTMSAGDGLLVRKRKGGQNGAITPVPISFIKNLDAVEEFEFAKFEKSTTPTSNVPNFQDCPTLLDAIRLGVMSKSPDICRRNGVSLETLGVNCENSLQLRFNNEGFPIASNDTLVSLGNLEDIRQALVENGCDSYKIKDSWIRNHTRLIVWKLAAYERSFSRFIGGDYLTYNRLIQNLTSRFQNETIEGVRPAIRKILNRDIAPSKMMILVVCRIIPAIESKHDNSSLPLRSLELSDGWYSVKGYLDKKLSEYVNTGLIKVGSKILISNARLMGSEEGIDPLDEGDGTNCDKCKSTLQLTANACRLARWNAKLGFVKATNNILISNGRLLIKRISDVFPGGGDIPAIRLFVERVYPLLFYEKTECNHPSHKKQILTAQEEDSRHREFENKKQKFYDKMIDKIRPEIEREIDEDAPDVWNRMMNSSSSGQEINESFGNHEKNEIDRWRDKRNTLMERRLREEVEAELEAEASLKRESKSFQKIRVHSIDPKNDRCESAMLTIWQPSEDQLSLIKEGTSIEIHNLVPRDTSYSGNLQLYANNRTIIESFALDDASSLMKTVEFQKRRFLNLFQAHKISHNAAKSFGQKQLDFDLVAVQLHVIEPSESSDAFTFYVTDETNLILRIHCKKPPLLLKTLLSGEESFTAYAMCDLVACPYDQEQQCAVAEFNEMSNVVMSNHHVERLTNWVSLASKNDLPKIVAHLKAELPIWEQTSNQRVSLGHIMGLRTESMDKIYIEVDCCGGGLYKWRVPLRVIHQMISTISISDLQVSLSPEQEDRIAKFGLIGSILRARGVLWRFQLSPGTNESVVCNAVEADKIKIGKLYE